MASKNEMLQQIRALQEENDALRYETTGSPREAIWLKMKAVTFSDGPSLIEDVVWAAGAVVRDGKFSRAEMIEFLLGREEG